MTETFDALPELVPTMLVRFQKFLLVSFVSSCMICVRETFLVATESH